MQRALARERRGGGLEDDQLLTVEHPPVITCGRTSDSAHLLAARDQLAARGIELHEVERGGDITYHGPGQVVGYPILDLSAFRRDLHWYLRRLEEAVIRTLGSLEIAAFRIPSLTGVWVGDSGVGSGAQDPAEAVLDSERDAPSLVREGRVRKIASIGVHASRWVTWHGFALNHTRDSLTGFEWIVPCGIEKVVMTSIETEGCDVPRGDVISALLVAFARTFQVAVIDTAA